IFPFAPNFEAAFLYRIWKGLRRSHGRAACKSSARSADVAKLRAGRSIRVRGIVAPRLSSSSHLRRLASLRDRFGGDFEAEKIGHLGALQRARLPSAAKGLRVHECLCFLTAYPDSAN